MTPWPALLRQAALAFAIPPAAFWRLSLTEWRALVGEVTPPLTRAGLANLAARFPDETA